MDDGNNFVVVPGGISGWADEDNDFMQSAESISLEVDMEQWVLN